MTLPSPAPEPLLTPISTPSRLRHGDQGSWTFGAGLARVFNDHVRRSIPGYADLHDQCCALVVPELKAGDLAYDLGCSTGELTARLAALAPEARVIGVDGEPEMIAEARRRQASESYHYDGTAQGGESYCCANLSRFEFEPARAAVLLYVLQFLPLTERKALLRRLVAALGTGGRLILAEKVRYTDPLMQARLDREYREFKLGQGFTPNEIEAKARQLEGVLVPLSAQENEALLREAGFRAVRPIFQALCFRAWLAET